MIPAPRRVCNPRFSVPSVNNVGCNYPLAKSLHVRQENTVFFTYIHGRLKEEKSDEDANSSSTIASTDVGIENDSDGGVEHEHEISLQYGGEPE